MSISFRFAACAFLASFLTFASSTPARAVEPDASDAPATLPEVAAGYAVDAAVDYVDERVSTMAPRRAAGLFELSLSLSLGHVPFRGEANTLLAESAVTYRAERSYYIRASLGPTGGIFGEPTRVATGTLSSGLDTRFFELGLAVGVARATDEARFPCPVPGQICTFAERSGPKLTLGVETRLGARDGLNITARVARTVPSDYIVGALELGAQIPLVPRVAINARALVALEYGHTQLSVGIRARVMGDGGRGTLYVVPGASWTGFSHYEIDRSPGFRNSFSGSLGLEYRL